jgi:hypothetical protein
VGFLRFAALLRTRQFRGRRPPRRPTCRLSVTSTSMILVEASAAYCLRIRSQTCVALASHLHRKRPRSIRMWRVRFLGFDPSVQVVGRPSLWTADSCCLALCLFRALGHQLAQRGGRVPAAFIGRRPSASGGSPLLSLDDAYRLCRNPAGSWTNVGLTRLLFSDSFGRCLVRPAWRYPTPDELPV